MRCPHCQTENREDRVACYHCGRDLTMVRLIVNRARLHFNKAVEHARDLQYYEALGELNSALELNARLVEALVLKGTILGRLERTEEAREAFQEALRIAPQAARAHRYLLELGDIEKTTPMRKRLIQAYGVAAVVALIGIGGLAAVTLSDGPVAAITMDQATSDPAATERAWALLAAGELRSAQEAALLLASDDRRALESAIERTIQDAFNTTGYLFEHGGFEVALASLRRIGEAQLRPADLEQFKTMMGMLATAQAERLESMMAGIVEALITNEAVDREAIARLQAQLDRTLERFPEAADSVERALAFHRQVLRLYIDEQIASLAGRDDQPSRTRTQSLAGLRPLAGLVQAAPALELALRDWSERDGERYYNEALAAARSGDEPAYRRAMEGLLSLPVLQDDLIERGRALRQVLLEREQSETLAQLTRALEDGERLTALQLAGSLEALGGALPTMLADRVQEARRRVAIDSYYRLMEMGDRLERGEITRAEAEDVQRLVALARGPLPQRILSQATEHLHFFAAQAWRVMGESDNAWQEMNELRRIYPDSVYLRYD